MALVKAFSGLLALQNPKRSFTPWRPCIGKWHPETQKYQIRNPNPSTGLKGTTSTSRYKSACYVSARVTEQYSTENRAIVQQLTTRPQTQPQIPSPLPYTPNPHRMARLSFFGTRGSPLNISGRAPQLCVTTNEHPSLTLNPKLPKAGTPTRNPNLGFGV